MKTSLFSILFLATAACSGCHHDICDITACTGGAGGAGGGDGAGGNAGGNGGGNADGGGGGGVAPGCTPTENQPIGDMCGVYVKKDAGGNGTKEMPFTSIAAAVIAVGDSKKTIFVCGGDVFDGSIDLPDDVSLIGGFDCDAWSYSTTNTRPTVAGSPNQPALRITGGEAALLSIRIEAADADQPSGSSIGLLISGAEVDIDEAEIVAKDARNGDPPPGQLPQDGPAPGGTMGAIAGTTPPANAAGGSHMCSGMTIAGGAGGKGGDHTQAVKDGGNGGPGDAGLGGTSGSGQTGAADCINGGNGTSGGSGSSGPGGTSKGQLSTSGFSPVDGSAGGTGMNGTSGGGGGGSMAVSLTDGAGGGGGGAGGCGGAGGSAGNGGGSSIALVSLNAMVTMSSAVSLVVGSGGDGAAGGMGQFGQPGGTNGSGGNGVGAVVAGCNGGVGRSGGAGGNGGGGRGGHALGIAYQGDAPVGGTVDLETAAAGALGPGGDNTLEPGGDGLAGIEQESLEF